ncbi:retrovirus-related pol polyprotein from transposon TNT 1-94 [Tanacetum coccineum]
MEEINNFQQEPNESLFRAWERFKELLMKCPQHYLTDMQEVILFYNGLDVPTRQILDSKGAISSKTTADAKIAIQEMAEYFQKWNIFKNQKYKYVIADLLPSLSINLISKSFYYSIIKDKDEGMSHAGTLIDIPIFVGSFSIIIGLTIIDDDDMTKDVVLGMKFCKKYASCQMIIKKFALEDKCERIMEDE